MEASSLNSTTTDISTESLLEKRDPPSFLTKIQRVWMLVKEVVFKEWGSVWNSFLYHVKYFFNRHIYNLNPLSPSSPGQDQETAKVVIFLHGTGGGPFCFLPMAKEMQKAGIDNVYAIDFSLAKEGPVPTETLSRKIEEITRKCIQKGFKKVEYALIGHSIGAVSAVKYALQDKPESDHASISMVISIAGRIKYVENSFSWFCEDIHQDIQKIYQSFLQNPEKILLYTIRGDQDTIVPEGSVHIQNNSLKEFTSKDFGHGGILYSKSAIDKITDWTKNWTFS